MVRSFFLVSIAPALRTCERGWGSRWRLSCRPRRRASPRARRRRRAAPWCSRSSAWRTRSAPALARTTLPLRSTMIAVGERAHHFEVVADEQISELVAALQVAQEVDDLRLHRHVERASRLVEDQEFRLEHHRAGDGDALALAAREFVRIAVLRRRDRARPPAAPARRARAARRGSVSGFWMSRPSSMICADRKARARASRKGPGTRSACRAAAAACASSRSRRCGCRDRRSGPSLDTSLSSASPSVVLPEPDSPTTPSVWPSLHRKIDRRPPP